LGQIKERGKIVVGTSADYPPYESIDADGKFVGFDMDLARAIGEKLGVKVEFQDMPFDSLIAAVQEGKIDVVIAAMQATPERDETVDFSTPYRPTKDAFLGAADSTLELKTGDDHATPVNLPLREGISLSQSNPCQTQVRFLAYRRIKPHAPPPVRSPVNFFEFHPCEHPPQAVYLMR